MSCLSSGLFASPGQPCPAPAQGSLSFPLIKLHFYHFSWQQGSLTCVCVSGALSAALGVGPGLGGQCVHGGSSCCGCMRACVNTGKWMMLQVLITFVWALCLCVLISAAAVCGCMCGLQVCVGGTSVCVANRCVPVPAGSTHSALLLAGPGSMELWWPRLRQADRFGNP